MFLYDPGCGAKVSHAHYPRPLVMCSLAIRLVSLLTEHSPNVELLCETVITLGSFGYGEYVYVCVYVCM